MQIVIEISVEDYAVILGNADIIRKRKKNTLEEAVLNGTPLPRHHGRLIDYDDLIEKLDRYGRKNVKYQLPYSPTIIEADKAESEDEKCR